MLTTMTKFKVFFKIAILTNVNLTNAQFQNNSPIFGSQQYFKNITENVIMS